MIKEPLPYENKPIPSISNKLHIVGFHKNGDVYNGQNDWEKTMRMSQKIISFIDTAGKENLKHSKIRGLAMNPDYALIVVDSLKIIDED